MSTLKHNIRHQQAQLAALEKEVLRGPRPLPPGIFNSPPMSPAELDAATPPSSFTPRIARRSSYDALQGLAGPDSSLPLPRRDSDRKLFGEENGIREGIPTPSGSGNRSSSPTRTLSRTCNPTLVCRFRLNTAYTYRHTRLICRCVTSGSIDCSVHPA